MTTTYVGLLRAVNVSANNRMTMAALREVLLGLGLRDVRTLLQSGNVVFTSDKRTPDQLERVLEAATKERLGIATEFFVRTTPEWNAVVAGNPFPKEAVRIPGFLVAVPLKDVPDRRCITALEQSIVGRETIRARERCLYVVYPDGIGRSKLTMAAIEKKLETRGTARNWNTVLKLQALAGVESPTP